MKDKLYLVVLNPNEQKIELFELNSDITIKQINEILWDVFMEKDMEYQVISRQALSDFATQCIGILV